MTLLVCLLCRTICTDLTKVIKLLEIWPCLIILIFFFLQEHWLTPANLCKFEEYFPQYSCFGSSAMTSCVENGILRGRPFGGVMTLVKKKLQKHSKIVCAADRYVIVSVGDLLIINCLLYTSPSPRD